MTTHPDPHGIEIADFDYPLPDSLIPRHPIARRDRCRLLYSGSDGEYRDCMFDELPHLLGSKSGVMVFNNTRVIHSRMHFTKPSGAMVEVFLLEPLVPADYVQTFQTTGECRWACMVGNLKRWKEGALSRELLLADGTRVTLTVERLGRHGSNAHEILFRWDNPGINFASIVETAGCIPIPPYLKRESETSDEQDYQTVYSKIKGSVAAPTAGLHFTPSLLDTLSSNGQLLLEVTLHVGAGTFQPVKSQTVGGHEMHTETFTVTSEILRELSRALRAGEPVTAVGTTSVRTLETLPYLGRMVRQVSAPMTEGLHLTQWEAYDNPVGAGEAPVLLESLADYADRHCSGVVDASTAIMIAPGFNWNVVSRMVTNFHQPCSTLLLLVSSFLNPAKDSGDKNLQWRRLYNHALSVPYRFLSYGDACLLERIAD